MAKRYSDSFEVHLRRNGVWTVELMGLSAAEARQRGESAFRRPGVEGMRIVRQRSSVISGSVTEDLMTERTRQPPSPGAVLGMPDEAPLCDKVDDLLRPAARLALHQLFRGWLGTHELGVTECLVSPKALRLLFDNSALVQSALHHVAALQTGEGEDLAPARARLASLIDGLHARAREVEAWSFETVEHDSDALFEAICQARSEADTWKACAGVRAYLSRAPSRLAKVEVLIGLLTLGDEPQALNLLDLFLADYLTDEAMALEMAGVQPFLSNALIWLASTAQGHALRLRRPPPPRDRHQFADALPALVAGGKIPRTRFVLLRAIDRVLRQGTPLNDGTSGREKGALVDLIRVLGGRPGFAGGPRLAKRLARRFATLSGPSNGDRFLEAVDTIVLGLTDARVQTRFLLALLSAQNSDKVQAGLLEIGHRAFTLYGGLRRLARRAPSARDLVVEIDGICLLIDRGFIDRKTRDAWTTTVLDGMEQALRERGDRRELRDLLDLAESTRLGSDAVRTALVRHLSRAAGIET